MTENDRRLNDYLAKIEAWHRSEHEAEPRHPVPCLNGLPPQQLVEKDELRALALGRLSEFRDAARRRRAEIEDSDIAMIRKLSPDAGAVYEEEIAYRRGMNDQWQRIWDAEHTERVFERWQVQEEERHAERRQRVTEQLNGVRPPEAEGGFADHARRESAVLDMARTPVSRGQSPERSGGRGR